MFAVELARPLHRPLVVAGVYEGRRVACGVEGEMLDIDVLVGNMEVRPVLAAAGGRGRVLVGGVVFVGNRMQKEEVGDLALFKRFHLFAGE